MVVAEHAAPVGQHRPGQLAGFGGLAAQRGQPGQGLAGGQGIGMVVAEQPALAAEGLADQVDGPFKSLGERLRFSASRPTKSLTLAG